eukprot:CAMPEP_0119293538 /NCGR_PEP_ID=MMETSP1329-20130426/46281_1 /TAXON_ID=114041 /ORGANISM="Genus nov. species nov., Strain RCC1024" /LENGTH=109 /DNA_ID=CAMNT_0007294411 /DNA_START=18 /DNA_END=344 /DNA_ORIENTATION=+
MGKKKASSRGEASATPAAKYKPPSLTKAKADLLGHANAYPPKDEEARRAAQTAGDVFAEASFEVGGGACMETMSRGLSALFVGDVLCGAPHETCRMPGSTRGFQARGEH